MVISNFVIHFLPLSLECKVLQLLPSSLSGKAFSASDEINQGPIYFFSNITLYIDDTPFSAYATYIVPIHAVYNWSFLLILKRETCTLQRCIRVEDELCKSWIHSISNTKFSIFAGYSSPFVPIQSPEDFLSR